MLPEHKREAELQRLMHEEEMLPFDLMQGPLMRAMLLRLHDHEHVLLVTVHHIVFDGWSAGVFYRELSTFYTAFETGVAAALPDLPIQYADFAIWQRHWFQGEALERQFSYWRKQLADLPVLQLHHDHPRPLDETFRGAARFVFLPLDLSAQLRALSRAEGVTLFILLLATFQLLLSRYTGQEDIVLGTVVANRNVAEIENLIGFFGNTLVLRTDLSDNPRFCDLLKRVHEVALDAYTHQDLPFEKLVEEFQPKRDPSRHPLFQVVFTMYNALLEPLELTDLTLRPLARTSSVAKFDLAVHFEDTEQGVVGVFTYNISLFDSDTIERMIGHFQTLLTGIVADSACPIAGLPLLTPTERQRLLYEWNATRLPVPEKTCIHDLIQAQSECTPHAIAVIFEQMHFTFAALEQRAQQLGHYLQSLGVGPDVLVGVYLERSVEMIVALLGILKAGGAYVPLDSAYPQEHISYILQDTCVSVLLTQESLLTGLPPSGTTTVCMDSDNSLIAQQRVQSIRKEIVSENLAYVLYTSGTTGRPKGIAITHRSAVAFLYWAKNVFGTEERAGSLAALSLCFDLSVFEIFVPLRWCGCVIVRKNVLHLPLVSMQNVTLLSVVPSAMTELLRMDAIPSSVRAVILGGEPLSSTLVQQIYEQGAVQYVYNLYGPTECTIGTTYTMVARDEQKAPSIGQPLTNAQVYVVDRYLSPVPIGIVGELYIGGAGVCRGYLNRPELTADRFIPDPWSNEPGARLYKTGDLVRYRVDGQLEFVGRRDLQVKVRGFRIELEEIKCALLEHPAVQDAVVLIEDDASGDKRLIAYVVLDERQTCSRSDLRNYLKQRLPDYMVPAAFVPLKAMPLAANGKIDRRSLPRPMAGDRELRATYVRPRK